MKQVRIVQEAQMTEYQAMMTPDQREEFLGRIKCFEEKWSGRCIIHPTVGFPGEACPLCGSDQAKLELEKIEASKHKTDNGVD